MTIAEAAGYTVITALAVLAGAVAIQSMCEALI